LSIVTAVTAALLPVSVFPTSVMPPPVGGGVDSLTVMVVDELFVPAELVAVNVTVNVPAAVNWCEGEVAVDVAVLSPKFHEYVGVGVPVDVFVNCTVNGGAPLVLSAVKLAVGAVFVEELVTVMVVDELFVPAELVAVNVTVNVPAAVNWCEGEAAVDTAVPSPKFHEYVGVGLPVELFVNCTVNGAVPLVLSAVNEATGAVPVGVPLPGAMSFHQ
jgi:hypothetical protein